MKRSITIKICVIVLFFWCLSAAHAMDAEALFKQLSPSIWVVHSFDAQGKPFALGSAVVIGAGRLITNCHVLAKASSFNIQHNNTVYPATLEFPDVERDLCQIKANNLTAPAVRIAPIDHLRVGQKVFAIGTPWALEETVSDGLLSALRLDKDGKLRYIQTSAPISHGSSGGGLFNDNGELIGITTLGIEGSYAQNISFAVPAEWIHDVPARGKAALEKPRVVASQTLPSPSPSPSPSFVQPPVRQAPPAAPSIANTGVIEKWNGLMACSARKDSGLDLPAYEAKFEMEANGTLINVHRTTDLVMEALTGRVMGNMLDLRGIGYRINDRSKIWLLKINGEFPTGATIFSGKGDMLSGGKVIRACELTMTRS